MHNIMSNMENNDRNVTGDLWMVLQMLHNGDDPDLDSLLQKDKTPKNSLIRKQYSLQLQIFISRRRLVIHIISRNSGIVFLITYSISRHV